MAGKLENKQSQIRFHEHRGFWLYLRRFSIDGFKILVMDEPGCSMYFYPQKLGFCGCGMEYSVLLNRLLLPLWRRMI
jgi:hypothetical protein